MRLWEDGFDHYGTSGSNMLDGSYATVGSYAPTTAQVATGTHSMGFTNTVFTAHGAGICRKVLPSAVTTLGKTFRIYMPALPNDNRQLPVIMGIPTSTADDFQMSVVVDINGALKFYRGMHLQGSSSSFGTLLYTSDPCLVAGAWQHVEIIMHFDNTSGWFRVAVDGVEVVPVQTGLDTLSNSDSILNDSFFLYSSSATASGGSFYIDDYILYDPTVGDPLVDTDFAISNPQTDAMIGELQVWPLRPNGDTAEADFAKSTGTVGYSLIDETTPDDTDYIYSVTAGDLSEFDLEDLPVEITYIRGLGIHARMNKSDSGTAYVKLGMKSVAATDDATERPLTVEPTYWRDTIDVDPNSSARWTRSSLNAAWLRITRSV